jgi:F420H(2)-dependent quinone reductase
MPTLRDQFNRLAIATHVRIYRATKGRIGGRFGSAQVLLLTTTGRKSGLERTVPLNGFVDGDCIVLVAANGGQDSPPGWFSNIQANPEVTVQRMAETAAMSGRVATPDERAELWPKITAWYRGYERYQEKTARQIPLVILT